MEVLINVSGNSLKPSIEIYFKLDLVVKFGLSLAFDQLRMPNLRQYIIELIGQASFGLNRPLAASAT